MGAAMLVGGLEARAPDVRPRRRPARSPRCCCWRPSRSSCRRSSSSCRGQGPAAGRAQERVNFGSTSSRCRSSSRSSCSLSYVAGPGLLAADAPRPLQPRRTAERRARTASRGRCASSVVALALAGVAVGVMSEILVGSISEASDVDRPDASSSSALIVVAIVGNAAEHWVAVYVARKDKMDLAVNIAIGSSAQIALFVGAGARAGLVLRRPGPDGARLQRLRARRRSSSAILIANHVTSDGESTWFEGCSCSPSTPCSPRLRVRLAGSREQSRHAASSPVRVEVRDIRCVLAAAAAAPGRRADLGLQSSSSGLLSPRARRPRLDIRLVVEAATGRPRGGRLEALEQLVARRLVDRHPSETSTQSASSSRDRRRTSPGRSRACRRRPAAPRSAD